MTAPTRPPPSTVMLRIRNLQLGRQRTEKAVEKRTYRGRPRGGASPTWTRQTTEAQYEHGDCVGSNARQCRASTGRGMPRPYVDGFARLGAVCRAQRLQGTAVLSMRNVHHA